MKAKSGRYQVLLLAAVLGMALLAPVQNLAMAAPAGTKATAAEKSEKEPKIKGIVLDRPNGGYLGLALEDHHFVLSFYDAKKKPTQADVARATARWPVHYKIGDEFAVLNPDSEGTALTSPKYVRPPYAFKLYLFLFDNGSDKSVEHYVINFHE